LLGVVAVDRSNEDRELAARLMAGDQLALRAIYDRYAGLVFGVARKVLGDEALAEDVAQEVFVFVWEHPERFDAARGSLRSWLGLLAHHRSVDRVRAEVRRTKGESRIEPAEPFAGADQLVDEELAGVWVAAKVRDAIDQLPREQRDALVLAYFGGRTYRQVATELAIPEGTAKSRLRLALAKLDELLRPSLSGQDAPAWT
jgi:RNA polymerase sigma-70 factor (ECF subfamily)